jgi:hypothetical protein
VHDEKNQFVNKIVRRRTDLVLLWRFAEVASCHRKRVNRLPVTVELELRLTILYFNPSLYAARANSLA